MAGGKTQGSTAPKVNGIAVQQSVYGAAVPLGWGTFRVSASLLWYGDFQSIANTTTQSGGGKGGGGSASNTTYTYTASVILGACAGPISGIRTVYRDKSVFVDGGTTALLQAGLSLASGALGQPVWGALTTNHPTEAIGYSGIAYAYATAYPLNDNGVLGNHSFEVQSPYRVAGKDDANPVDILGSFLNLVPLWPGGLTADTNDFMTYCLASGLLLSPVLDAQRKGADFITEILRACNSEAVWSEGKIRWVPYGDTQITGNGVTWTPNLTPIYDLTDADFIPGAPGDEPVLVDIVRPADAYNYIQVEYLDRAHQYNTQVVPGTDQANIEQFGKRQNKSPVSLHCICDGAVAATIAQIIVQRSCHVRSKYRFTLGDNFCLLEPMDLVTITTGELDHVLVRIIDCKENTQTGEIDFIAEEMLVGTSHAANFTRQAVVGFQPNYDSLPGNTTDFALMNPAATLTQGRYEAWLAASGDDPNWGGCEIWVSTDGTNYERKGIHAGKSRIGLTTSTLISHADPHTAGSLDVSFAGTQGSLVTASASDYANAVTLSLVGTELIAYRDATLISTYGYTVAYLRRALYGTTAVAHGTGEVFVRLDDTISKLAYDAQQVGSTIYVKLLSFNTFGRQTQSLAAVTATTLTLNPGASPVVHITADGIVGQGPLATSLLTEADVWNALIKIPSKNLWRKVDWALIGATTLHDPLTPVGLAGVSLWGLDLAHSASAQGTRVVGKVFGNNVGDYYSFTCWAAITAGSGTATLRAGFTDSGGSSLITGLADQLLTVTTTWQRFTWEGLSSTQAAFISAQFRLYALSADITAGQTVTVTDLMMNYGSKASTAWVPSPDDVSLLRYAGYIGSLTATTNNITRSSSAPSTPTTGDIWIDNSISGAELLKTWTGSIWVISSTVGGSFGTNLYRTPGGTLATLTDFLTSSGVASAVAGQTSWATDTSLTPTNVGSRITYLDTNGQIYDRRGLPINVPIGYSGGRAIWPITSTSSSISVTGYTDYRTGTNISIPSGTYSGLSADTLYDVFYRIPLTDIIAIPTGGSYLYMIDQQNYVYIGRQQTQASGGGYIAAPPAPPGSSGGGSRGDYQTAIP